LLVALLGAMLGSLLVAAATFFPVFGLSVLRLGAGAGFFFVPASSLLSSLYANDGRVLGVLTAAGAVSGLVYPAVGGIVVGP